MTRTDVVSSNVASIGYDPEKRLLEVEFKVADGKPPSIYQYENVDRRVFDILMRPDVSVGKLFHHLVKRDPAVVGRRLKESVS